ncbi:hypothetical protein N9J89_01805 [Bacteroidia bacterium]|jgi:nitrite reductase/ring-hydroxylating ferredoxin subunit|nr:hypothetical protein [Bacteroidia bacterium]MDA9110966.1 hypothetical protein [Bacteroidia bacterium]MDB4173663.1 hypothetical protein [Bacteroidia bacterium]
MKKIAFILCCVALSFNQSCKPDDPFTGDCFIPDAAVNITINMDLPEYFNLRNLGEFVSFESQGHRGVYVIHNFDDIYYAIERTCSYQSDLECARVELDNDILQLRCGSTQDTGFVDCCGSAYNFNSGFISGPTRCNLKTYRVSRSGNSLYVSN